jgi:SSS family solute:Na+ symporter
MSEQTVWLLVALALYSAFCLYWRVSVASQGAMWLLSGILFVYVGFGGLRAAAYVGALQALMLGAGIVAIGVIVYWQAGGFGAFNVAIGKLGASGALGPNPFEISGVVVFNRGLGIETPAGGIWTASMILSYCLALMGLQLAPHFSILAFAARSPNGFVSQQTWASAAIMGAILVIFSVAQGLGAHLDSGADPSTVGGGAVALVIASVGVRAPWFLALLGVCALAAVQGLAALQLSATSTMVVRDFYRRYVNPDLNIEGQRLYARVAMALLLVITLAIATFAPEAQAELGALALGFGLQLLPALLGLCWFRWITREGAMVGLAFGLLAVIFTEKFGLSVAEFVGVHLPWGRWPWTLHSAGWGIVCNVVACLVTSLISQRDRESARRGGYHAFLTAYASEFVAPYHLRQAAWAGALAWLFLAIGPGALLRQLCLRRPQRRACGVVFRYAIDLGLANSLVGRRRFAGLVSRQSNGHVDDDASGDRTAPAFKAAQVEPRCLNGWRDPRLVLGNRPGGGLRDFRQLDVRLICQVNQVRSPDN